MSVSDVPEGFAPFPLDNTFNDAFAPMFIRMGEKGPQVGMRVEKHHLNPMDICHGAVYMVMFDIAFACVIGHTLGKYTGTPTMNINIDYVAASREGEWIYTDAECLKTTRTAGYAQGVIRSANGIKAGGSGIFKLPQDLENARGMGVDQNK